MKSLEDGIIGLVVGDALGVPFEFSPRSSMEQNPVTDMESYGTHNQPKGTWSDDSSLTLITYEVLKEKGNDLKSVAEGFVRWFTESFMTAHGEVFDIGITTHRSLERLQLGFSPLESGEDNFRSNGNGSLMRILPLLKIGKPNLDIVKAYSSITHSHPISIFCCFYYLCLAWELLNGKDKWEAIRNVSLEIITENSIDISKMIDNDKESNYEINKILNLDSSDMNIAKSELAFFGSGTYVIDTLASSLSCLLFTNSYKDSVLKAVNLGGDTDTTAAVVGGLAGIYYGKESIPLQWKKDIVKNELIEYLI